jgi:2-iminoacetate synthase
MSAATKVEPAVDVSWLDPARVEAQLEQATPDRAQVEEILAKARELRGLSPAEAAVLARLQDPEQVARVLDAAIHVKETIYGPRIVMFAPLYVSNVCANECSYCAFRAGNDIERRTLTRAQVIAEVEALVRQGHKRVLVVAGESRSKQYLDHVLDTIDAVYSVKLGQGEIRRVNANLAPMDVASLRRLKGANIGTYQVFQETYHPGTYARFHLRGPKADFAWRLSVMDRAMEAGLDDVGIGPLLGLHDWKYELVAMLHHVAHLEARFGVGPHTISVPRMEPASGSDLAAHPPHPVPDDDFARLVAILRLAVPYTGIIMSTRETPELRRRTLRLGVSQISAGSRTDVGGYTEGPEVPGQFQLGDHRSLEEIVRDLAEMEYVPSFCTACYRLGRTGADFMDLAKPGEIKHHCDPNALATLREYLQDYGSAETVRIGKRLIADRLEAMDEKGRRIARKLLDQVESGKHDVLV